MRRLVLFDVDGTLIKRGDPDHLAAMDHGVFSAFPEATWATVHRVDYDGKVDRLIASEVLAQAGINLAPEDPALDRVFEHASTYYREKWAHRDNGLDDLLPGVPELVDALIDRADEFALGVLTGGSHGIVAVKLDRLGLTSAFPVGAFGDEVRNRPALVPLVMQRAAAHYEQTFRATQTVIVGDTPHDVHCAHVHRVPCLGVATGKYSALELRDAGADEVLGTLEDVQGVIDLLISLESADR